MSHVDRYLAELAHGELPQPIERRVRVHVSTCHRCRRSLRYLRGVAGRMPQSLIEVAPPPHVRAQQDPEASEPSSFFDLLEPLAQLFDLSTAQAHGVLVGVAARDDRWRQSHHANVSYLHVRCGPRRPGSSAMLVRFEGAEIPAHTHTGDESVLVLQGGFQDSEGDEAWRGDLVFKPQGSRHALKPLEGPPCIYAVCVDPPRN